MTREASRAALGRRWLATFMGHCPVRRRSGRVCNTSIPKIRGGFAERRHAMRQCVFRRLNIGNGHCSASTRANRDFVNLAYRGFLSSRGAAPILCGCGWRPDNDAIRPVSLFRARVPPAFGPLGERTNTDVRRARRCGVSVGGPDHRRACRAGRALRAVCRSNADRLRRHPRRVDGRHGLRAA